MSKLFLLTIAILPYFCCAEIKKQQWTVQDVGTLALFDCAHALEFNDQGQVLLYGSYNNKKVWAIGSSESGITILPELSTILKSPEFATEISWQRINDSGVALGTRNIINSRLSECTLELITWEALEGLKKYKITSCKIPYQSDPKIAQCGNSDSVVLTFEDQIYRLQNGKLINLSPLLLHEIQKIDFNFNEIKWLAIAVNKNGTIYGKFDYYELHPYKKKPVILGEKYFLFDEKRITIIEIPENIQIYISDSIRHLNNNNEVLFNDSWLWDETSSLRKLTYFSSGLSGSGYTGHAIAYLDGNTTVFAIPSGGGGTIHDILFQNADQEVLLKFYDAICSNNIDKSKYKNLKSHGLNTDICLVNNKRHFVFSGRFLMEDHPFLLTP